ncbi:MAG: hypothetical protein L7U72_03360 [Rubripirellula sp.]|nr:hypothetical protein [Rubripirellula sp.]
MPNPFIDPALLFQMEIPLRHWDGKWESKGVQLPEIYQVPCFAEFSDRQIFSDIRLGWNPNGLVIQVSVKGKRQTPWCRETRLDESDGFHLWIDTRCSPGIHRATQYCHRFLWMPSGGGPRRESSLAAMVPINRARSHPRAVDSKHLPLKTNLRHNGYEISAWIPREALTGYSPEEQPRVAIYYAVIDRELGWQGLTLGPEYPVTDDPSLWSQANLLGP